MDYIEDNLPLVLPLVDSSIIKVIGVGGGGGNAVNHMYLQGIADVNFVVCNTDNQALIKSPVPTKIQLGTEETLGLGAGSIPEVGRKAAEESIEKIQNLLKDNTKMVFITAGMGGGTGTGASPIIAKAAHDMGILTVGIVTIPFAFEGKRKIRQALEGVAALSEHVDAILVINNEKLRKLYPDFELSNAFAKADDVLTNAAKGIAEIITVTGYINLDFADVFSTMKDGNVAIMNTGFASGENRITKAIENALNSPLLNTNDVSGASKVLLSLYCSKTSQIKMEEVQQIHDFMNKVGDDVQVIWGATFDDDLDDDVKITIIATGYDVSGIPGMPSEQIQKQPIKVIEKKPQQVIFDKNMVNQIANQKNSVDSEEVQVSPIQIAMTEYYDEKLPEIEIIEIPDEELSVFSLEDLENESTFEKAVNIPAWKRKLLKK
jgi:cell division protein FtsZ